MYEIEWTPRGDNSLNSLHIDGREYSNDCQKFALRCNELEQILQDIYEMLPSEYDDYLQNPKILAQIQEEQKWVPYPAAEEILGKKNLEYFITQGELGWSVIGELKVFDKWDIVQVQTLIKGSNENNMWDAGQIQELINNPSPIAMTETDTGKLTPIPTLDHCPWCNKDVLQTTSGQGYCTCGFEK